MQIYFEKNIFLELILKVSFFFTLEETYFCKIVMNRFNTLHIPLFLAHINPYSFCTFSIGY
jgi:hypothetical protein